MSGEKAHCKLSCDYCTDEEITMKQEEEARVEIP